jgi:GNAT superfamily N-acetyltransferase
VRLASTVQDEGTILYTHLKPEEADDVIREQVAYFESLEQSFEWKVYNYDSPADLVERLRAFGFEIEETEAILVLPLEEASERLFEPTRQDVRKITQAHALADLESVERAVWEEDFSVLIRNMADGLENTPQQWDIFVAYVNDTPSAAAWMYYPPGSQFASLWGGSTLPEQRGKGLYSALLSARAQEARSRGMKYLTVDAGPMSRPILERFGFRLIGYATPCKWKAAT